MLKRILKAFSFPTDFTSSGVVFSRPSPEQECGQMLLFYVGLCNNCSCHESHADERICPEHLDTCICKTLNLWTKYHFSVDTVKNINWTTEVHFAFSQNKFSSTFYSLFKTNKIQPILTKRKCYTNRYELCYINIYLATIHLVWINNSVYSQFIWSFKSSKF